MFDLTAPFNLQERSSDQQFHDWRRKLWVFQHAFMEHMLGYMRPEHDIVQFNRDHLQEMFDHFLKEVWPSRLEAHCGDCTDTPAPCARCGIEADLDLFTGLYAERNVYWGRQNDGSEM